MRRQMFIDENDLIVFDKKLINILKRKG